LLRDQVHLPYIPRLVNPDAAWTTWNIVRRPRERASRLPSFTHAASAVASGAPEAPVVEICSLPGDHSLINQASAHDALRGRRRHGTLSRPPATSAGWVKRSGSAFLEQDEARFGQHPLLPRGQAATGLPSRQVADYLNDLDQIS